MRELEENPSAATPPDLESTGNASPMVRKPGRWKRAGKWVLITLVAGAVAVPVINSWAVYWFGPQGKWFQKGKLASIQFTQAVPFVDRAVAGDDWAKTYWNIWYFRIGIHNRSTETSLRVKYVKLTDWQHLEANSFRPWPDAEEVQLEWPSRQPREVAPQDTVYVPFARIFPPELQMATDTLLSGDINVPQLRFTVAGWPRRMTSHIPPGTHRFKVKVFFEQFSPANAAFELEWPKEPRDNIEAMVKAMKIRKLESR